MWLVWVIIIDETATPKATKYQYTEQYCKPKSKRWIVVISGKTAAST
jgi:hypothetical protein